MTTKRRWPWDVALILGLLMMAPVATSAQEEVGGLYGTVTDADRAELPGVSIVLGGVRGVRTQISDTQGKFRFLGLDPGTYSLQASLDGFSTVEYPEIVLTAGRNTSVEVELPSAIGEVITVTAESPLLDDRKLSRGTVVVQTDLESIPTARDPWALLTQAPGVLQDRVNVGGSESGSQSKFIAPTSAWSNNSYLVDGVEITDMMATGSSPTYYDFEQFTQVELSTGGTEITKMTPGVSITMTTRRGTNELRGSARFFLTDAAGYFGVLEAGEPRIDSDELGEGQEEEITGNRTDRIQEYGFEAGGPVWRDRVWLWGSWATTEARDFSADGQLQAFQLENTAVKLNAQLTAANSLVASWNNGDKTADRGASPARAPETVWRQRGPTAIYKLEDTHLFSSSLFASGTWSKVDAGFTFATPGGAGPESPEPLQDSDGVLKRNTWNYFLNKPQENWQLEGSYFFGTGTGSHELRFGARYRQVEGNTSFAVGGRQLWHIAGENWGEPPGPIDFLMAYRGAEAPLREEFTSLWVQDTLTLGRWTANAGLRWDLQEGENLPSTVQANPAFPELMPSIEFAGNDGGFDFTTISPRLGLTRAVGDERQTLLRASYARFAQNLEAQQHLWRVNPLGGAYIYFYFFDGNDNNTWDSVEVDGDPIPIFWFGINPADPAAIDSPNLNAPGLSPEITDELVVAVEHALRPDFVIGANLDWRRVTDVQEIRKIVRDPNGLERLATRDDYFLDRTATGLLPDGRPYAADFYALHPGRALTGGDLLTNGDRERRYLGATLTATKRLTNRWMLRGYLQYGETTWSIPDSFYFYNDPTDDAGAVWNTGKTSQDNDGDLYFESFEAPMMQSTWTLNLNGMYQVAPERPWGFDIAGNLYGRQGFPLPYWVQATGSDRVRRNADAVTADQFRLRDLVTADLRLEKEFATSGNVGLTFSIDAFNIFNDSTVLARSLRLNGRRPDFVDETLAPRIFRLGVRLSWR